MPQVGERKTISGVTGEWDGTTWRKVQGDAAPQAAEPQGQAPALDRFLQGGMKTSPLNPMNWMRALAHPIDTLSNMVSEPVQELGHARKEAFDTVLGDPEEGRAMSAVNTAKHLVGAVPLIGKPIMDAATKFHDGDQAGSFGELLGLISAPLAGDLAMDMGQRAPGAAANAAKTATNLPPGPARAAGSAAIRGFNPAGIPIGKTIGAYMDARPKAPTPPKPTLPPTAPPLGGAMDPAAFDAMLAETRASRPVPQAPPPRMPKPSDPRLVKNPAPPVPLESELAAILKSLESQAGATELPPPQTITDMGPEARPVHGGMGQVDVKNYRSSGRPATRPPAPELPAAWAALAKSLKP